MPLILPEYIALLEEYRDQIEIGLWLEVVQPMAEEADIPWKGRWPGIGTRMSDSWSATYLRSAKD